jgi:predicted phosphoribosyltransferase
MVFASRQQAGEILGRLLQCERTQTELVLGLPRGGVVVAAQVARVLGRPLDVLVVRKIGHPLQREFAVGAMAEPDVFLSDPESCRGLPQTLIDEVIAEERIRLADYAKRFHPHGAPDLTHKAVLLVDDGIATGATAEAAVLGVRHRGARRIHVATPVASTEAFRRLRESAVQVTALLVQSDFGAVGHFYSDFSQTTDQEVLDILAQFGAPA